MKRQIKIETEWIGDDLIIHYCGKVAMGDLRIDRLRGNRKKEMEVIEMIGNIMYGSTTTTEQT